MPPLHLSTTYARDESLALYGDTQYVREGNPTQTRFERAMAMAVVDLSVDARGMDAATAQFLAGEKSHMANADEMRMRQVEATRVEMETF